MSAFNVGQRHIDYLVAAAIRYEVTWAPDHRRIIDPDRVGAMLVEANTLSVNYRYSQTAQPEQYTFRPVIDLSPVQVLKAIRCFEYQSCEHKGWKGSEAWEFCQVLRLRTCENLPGYKDARWEVL